jgi:integrase
MEPATAAPAASRQGQEAFTRLIGDYLQEKRARGASPRTVGHYKEVLTEVLLPFCREAGVRAPADLTNRHLNDLGAGHLDGTRSRSKRPISKATVHSYLRAINSFLTWARAQGEASAARGRLPSMRKRVLDTLTREEIQAMEDAATTKRDKLIVRVLADTGLRLGELLALRPAATRSEAGKHVLKAPGRERATGRRGWVGDKDDRERLVPISAGLARRLRRFADRGRPDATSDRLFLTLRRGHSRTVSPHSAGYASPTASPTSSVASPRNRTWRPRARDSRPKSRSPAPSQDFGRAPPRLPNRRRGECQRPRWLPR